jgi:Flp pilus assembly pilin Flp
MDCLVLKLYVKFQNLTTGEDGQDLVEYALLCTLITLALISGISGLAAAVTRTFTNISSSLA